MHRLKSEIIQWMHSKRRVTNMLVGISAALLYEIVRAYYRPFIYSNAINDFHIADTLGNSLGTIATVFVFASIFGHNSTKDHFLIRSVTISVLVYELAHPLLGKPIDPWDMIATVIAGIFCMGLYRLLHGPAQSVPKLLFAVVSDDEAKTVPYPYVYVADDGTVRELHQSERSYLQTPFHPADGARPYVKSSFDKKDGWDGIGGFCLRSKVPANIDILESPMEDPTEYSRKMFLKKQIKFAKENGFEVIENSDGTVTLHRKPNP